jgi:hypothetical protein
MHSTLNPKPTDDPHDIVVVAPDDVRVAPAEEELSNLLRQAARHHSPQQTHAGSGLLAGPPVPPVDTTFRPAAENVQIPGQRRWIGRGVVRAFTALLLAACISVAGIAWQSDAAKKMIAKVATQLVVIASLSPEKSGPPAQPAASAAAAADASAAAPQPTAPAQSAAAPSADSAQLQSMSRDLASAAQEIEQLKASIEQLKASQQQMSRDIAKSSENKASENRASENKASEQSARPRISALPPRPAAARARKPIAPYPPPQAAAASTLPPGAAPYYAPRQIEPPPQTTAPPLTDPELASVPRPPMPVR